MASNSTLSAFKAFDPLVRCEYSVLMLLYNLISNSCESVSNGGQKLLWTRSMLKVFGREWTQIRRQSAVEFAVCGPPVSIKEHIFTVAVRMLHSGTKNPTELLSIYGPKFHHVVSDLGLNFTSPPRLNIRYRINCV